MSCCDQKWCNECSIQNSGSNLDCLLDQILTELNNCKKTASELEVWKWKINHKIDETKDELERKCKKEIKNIWEALDEKVSKKDFNKTKSDLEAKQEQLAEEQKKLQENCDKAKQEIAEIKKEFENKLKDAIDGFKKELEEQKKATEDLKKTKWVVGEYRWMPIGSVMPQGWVKVALPKGFTLIQGLENGRSSGSVKSHKHDLQFPALSTRYGIGYGFRPASTTGRDAVPYTLQNDHWVLPMDTKVAGIDNNLAAGVFAELWQYIG